MDVYCHIVCANGRSLFCCSAFKLLTFLIRPDGTAWGARADYHLQLPISGAHPHHFTAQSLPRKAKFRLHSIHQRLRNPTALHTLPQYRSTVLVYMNGSSLLDLSVNARRKFKTHPSWLSGTSDILFYLFFKFFSFFLQNPQRIVLDCSCNEILVWDRLLWSERERGAAARAGGADISPAYQFNYCCHGSQALGKGQ